MHVINADSNSSYGTYYQLYKYLLWFMQYSEWESFNYEHIVFLNKTRNGRKKVLRKNGFALMLTANWGH